MPATPSDRDGAPPVRAFALAPPGADRYMRVIPRCSQPCHSREQAGEKMRGMRGARAVISVPPRLRPLLERPQDWPPCAWHVSVPPAAQAEQSPGRLSCKRLAPKAVPAHWSVAQSAAHSAVRARPGADRCLEILRVLVTDVDAHRSAALPLPVRGHRAPQRHVQVGTLDMQPSTGDRPAGRTISRNRRAAGTARLKRRRRATEAASSVPSAQALDPLESGHAKVGSSLSPMIPKGTSAVLQLQQSRHRTCLQGRP